MQYVLLSDSFGGLNTYMAADKVGPNGAVVSSGVDVSAGELKNRYADTEPTLDVNGVWVDTDTYVPANSQTIVAWKTGSLGMPGRYSVAAFAGRLYRSHKGMGPFPADTLNIQYTSDTNTPPTWDILGLSRPGTPALSVASAGSGSVPAGSYVYYCTFYNAAGHESPPMEASSSLVLTVASSVTVTLPRGYTTATFSNGSTTITVVNKDYLRVGMRLAGAGIDTETYITDIAQTTPPAATVTISKPTTAANVTNNYIYDAQISGIKIYRQNIDTMTAPLFVKSVTGLSNATTPDNVSAANLGLPLETLNNSDFINYFRDVCISPSGTLMCVGLGSTLYYFSLSDPGLFDATKFISVADEPLAMIYALDRFICPTTRGAFSVTLDDAILGIPVLQYIDTNEPCQVSYATYAVDIGGEVWWNTNRGIVSTNGSTIETITRFTFDRTFAEDCIECWGAELYNGEYIAYVGKTNKNIISWTRQNGWRIIQSGMSTVSNGSIGFHINQGCIVYTGTPLTQKVRLLQKSSSRKAGGLFRPGDWTGEKSSALKKFRKISALFSGDIELTPYVNGVQVGGVITASNASMDKKSWWLPSGSKGRSFSVEIKLASASATIEEIGVWVGEEREAMP